MRKERGARVENRFGMLERTIIRWHAEISHYRMLPSEAGELSIVIIVNTVKESDEKTSEAPLPKSEQTSLSQKTPTEEKV